MSNNPNCKKFLLFAAFFVITSLFFTFKISSFKHSMTGFNSFSIFPVEEKYEAKRDSLQIQEAGRVANYTGNVDFRIIILTHNRHKSLKKLLESLQNLELDGDKAAIEIWIDPSKDGLLSLETFIAAKSYNWSKGDVRVHIHDTHVGILGQWIDTWTPASKGCNHDREIALILEDDLVVSKYAYRFLRAVHKKYGKRDDFAGASLTCQNLMAHNNRKSLTPPNNHSAFMYAAIGTWGFSPSNRYWSVFQEWYHEKKERNDGIKLKGARRLQEKKKKKEKKKLKKEEEGEKRQEEMKVKVLEEKNERKNETLNVQKEKTHNNDTRKSNRRKRDIKDNNQTTKQTSTLKNINKVTNTPTYKSTQKYTTKNKQTYKSTQKPTTTKTTKYTSTLPQNHTSINAQQHTFETSQHNTPTTPEATIFYPLVKGLKPSEWYEDFIKHHFEDSMWSMWFVYFAYHHNLYTVYSNIMDSSKRNRVCIAANSFAAGLHFGNMEIKNIEKTLLTTWNDSYIEELPDNLVKFDWNGTIV